MLSGAPNPKHNLRRQSNIDDCLGERSSNIAFIEKCGAQGNIRFYAFVVGQVKDVTNKHRVHDFFIYIKDTFKQIFLPVGYPNSVSEDYLLYQAWDTVQACCSTITGTFTTQSLLKSLGVGNQSASALGAAITWIIKDGSGMGGRIIFAWWHGSSLDADCKYWRLFADILNDIALTIEYTLPLWNLTSNLYVLCLTSTMKSLVGVAGGATRAAITQHQAISDNMGDVSAKDGSQETCVNLLASIIGIYLLTNLENHELCLGIVFTVLTLLHIFANYKAVRALVFRTLNVGRFLITFNSYMEYDAVANPIFANKSEPLCSAFHRFSGAVFGFKIKMGHSLNKPLNNLREDQFQSITIAFKGLEYIIVPHFKNKTLYVAFSTRVDSETVLKAYFHSILLAVAICHFNDIPLQFKSKRHLHHATPLQRLNNVMKNIPKNEDSAGLHMFSMRKLQDFNAFVKIELVSFFTALEINGWDLKRNSLDVGEWRYLPEYYMESSSFNKDL